MENKKSLAQDHLEALTRREQNILGHLANNKTSQEIAKLEVLADSTVKWYIQQVYAKLGVNKRSEAIHRARGLGLLQPEPLPFVNTLGVKNNLPAELTHFFGRETEILQVKEQLAEWRLVTLTGSGGVGRTRLAQRVAAQVLSNYSHGVWFIDLASTSNPELVTQQVAISLNLHEEPGRLILDRLKVIFSSRTILLVLDNCEHLLDACARLVDSLLRACPKLKILATSQEPLGVAGEAIFRVPSLPFPMDTQVATLEMMESFAAIQLFVDQARLILPGYQITTQNAGAIASICQRLDGIPLAIELAAARLRLLTAEELANRLNNIFHLLTGGNRAALPRQQTLHATIDWSYNLLNEQERRLLRRLSVFSGGWNLADAEGVCSGDALEVSEILELLANLVNKSMVMVSPAGSGWTRYRMLETIRQYAREKLLESLEMAVLQRRHLVYFVELAETLEPQGRGPNQIEWRRQLEEELENIRFALTFGLREDPSVGLRLASALWLGWQIIDRSIDEVGWLRAYLDHPENAAHTAQRGLALWRLSFTSPFVPGSEAWAQESLEIFLIINDRSGQGCAQWGWGNCAFRHEDYSIALLHFQSALEIFEEIQDRWWLALTLYSLAQVTLYQGDSAGVLTYLEKALVLFRETGDQYLTAFVLVTLGWSKYLFQGDLHRGYIMLEEALAIFRQIGYGEGNALFRLAEVLCWQGEFERASQAWGGPQHNAQQPDDDLGELMSNLYLGRFICWQGKLEAGIDLMEQTVRRLKEFSYFSNQLAIQQTFLMELAYAHACLGEIERAESLVSEFGHLFRDAQYQSRLMTLLGFLALQKGEAELSIKYYQESLQHAVKMHWCLDALLALEGYSWALQLNGKPVEAAHLLGAAGEFRARISASVFPRDRQVYDRVIAKLKNDLGEEGYAVAWAEGQRLGFERGIDNSIAYTETNR